MGGQTIPGKRGADEGIDSLWETPGRNFIIQCKRRKNQNVGSQVVKEVFGTITKFKVYGAFIVTTAEFTDPAIRFAEELGLHIGFIDGKELFNLLTQITPNVITETLERQTKRK